MGDLTVTVPDHCLPFYFVIFTLYIPGVTVGF